MITGGNVNLSRKYLTLYEVIKRLLASDTASLDPVYGSLEPSIQAMKELLRNYLPNLFLEYHPTLMQEKLDAARDTIQFLEKALHGRWITLHMNERN